MTQMPAQPTDQSLPPAATGPAGWGAARAAFPVPAADLLPARFAAWAERHPGRVAVSYPDADPLRYGELRVRVARLAHRLRGLGVGPGSLVGIWLPRGPDLVTAVLAVASAGGGYLPVDHRDPTTRVRTILSDASVPVLVTDRALADELGGPDGAGPVTVCLDDPSERERLAALPQTLPPWTGQPHDVAYVIYTSGSTGTPKGVVVEHAQLARLFDATREWFQFGPDEVWTLFHSIAFDFSVWELWGALGHGGRLVVVPDPVSRDPARFRELLLAERVTVLNQTPSAFRLLMHADLAAGPPADYRLRWLVFGGERLDVAGLRPWLDRYGDRRPRLVNMYGITETTVHVTYRPIRRADLATGVSSPIGRPIPDLAVRLVDPAGAPVPVGEPGEIQVGGAGVARGYLNRPELTADRFLNQPNEPNQPGRPDRPGGTGPARWYRTGDLARWLPDGELEFLGRLDDQVKIRGHRIEPGEVESVLTGHPQVRQAAVVTRQAGPDRHRQLVAYLVPEPGSELSWPAVRGWLAERLPDQLVPATAVSLDRLPLNPNGKLDRAALPAPVPPRPDGPVPAAPRTGVEQVLVEVIAEVLELDRVGTSDNFFELGGDSILTIQVAARAHRRGVAVTPAQVFTHQTVAELATVADQVADRAADPVAAAGREPDRSAGPRRPPPAAPTPGDYPLARVDQRQLDRLVAQHGPLEDLYPLAPLQRGLLFHTLANPHSGVYFEQFSLPLTGPLDVEALIRAWTGLHERHAVLRAAVAWQGLPVPHLAIRPEVELPLTQSDWREVEPAQQPEQLAELLATDRTQGFDLSAAPLTRLRLIRLADRRWQLTWSHHHILLDRWSVALLIQEIFDSYEAIRTGQHQPAPPPRPYRDYLAYLAGLDLTRAPAYWRRLLAGVTRPTPLGADRPADPTRRRDADYARAGRQLPADRSEAVREFVRAHRLTLDTVLHGAWALLLAQRSGLDEVVFGVTSAGRPPALAGVEEMIGLFINTLPARVRVRRDQPVAGWLAGLMRDQAEARELEHTPLDQIRSWSAVPPDQPLFESGRALVNFPWDGSRSRTGNLAVGEIQTFEQASHALTFVAVPAERLDLQLWYDARRFRPETAEALVRGLEALVLALAAAPNRPVGEVLAQLPATAAPATRPAAESTAEPAPGSAPGPAPGPAPGSTAGPARVDDTGRHPDDLDRLTAQLRELPMVSEAVVVPAPDRRRLTAYLLPAAAALAGTAPDGEAGALARRHLESRRGRSDPDPVPAADRRELAARIQARHPARILAVGWGDRPPLPGLPDACDSYRECPPEELAGLAAGSVDAVVLDSVVPAFPGAGYLTQVLDEAIRVTAADGAVVLSGLRHHGLREAYHTAVELSRSVAMLPTEELHRRVRRALAADPELSVDPRWLTGYAAGRPEIGAVEVIPARGRDDATGPQYRYHAVLRLGKPPPEPETEWYDWHRDVLSPDEIEWLLDRAGGDAVGICRVPDPRVAAEVEAARLLAGTDPPGTAGKLRSAAGASTVSGMDPAALHRLGERTGWSVAVTWSAYRSDGSLHARFCRTPGAAAGAGLATAIAGDGAIDGDADGDAGPPTAAAGPLTSTPLRPALVEELTRRAATLLAEARPDQPAAALVVDELPRTAGGEVDQSALPATATAVEPAAPAGTGPVPPRTADELRLARIWEQALGVSSVDVRTSFFDLGGDSMLAIRLVDEATRALGRDLPLAVLLQQPTIEGMAAALSAEPRPWSPLVEINPGTGNPFFCVHPAGGNVICYAELARLVRPYPFYALQARGVEGDDPPHDDIPAMATRYLADVRARQPTGPYLLGGWSMGGLVAYEMARQLVAAGEPVGLVLMVDTPTPELAGELPDQAATLARLLDGVVPVDLAELRAMPAQERLRFVLSEAERARVIPPGVHPDRAQQLFEVFTAHQRAVGRYRPGPFAGPVRLLRAVDSGITAPDYGWGGLLSGEWRVLDVPGDHDSVVWPPHVQRVAEVLRAELPPPAR